MYKYIDGSYLYREEPAFAYYNNNRNDVCPLRTSVWLMNLLELILTLTIQRSMLIERFYLQHLYQYQRIKKKKCPKKQQTTYESS